MLLKNLFFSYIFCIFLIILYKFDIFQANEYMGYKNFDINLIYIMNFLLGTLLVSYILPIKISRPSDFFFLIYSLIVLLPLISLYPIYTGDSTFGLYGSLALLLFPILVFKFTSFTVASLKISFSLKVSFEYFIVFLLIIMIVTIIYGWLSKPSSASFELLNSYNRRIEARDIYISGSLSSYLNAMVINGISPFLAFYGGYSNRKKLFIFALITTLVFFYILGTKSPIFFVLVSFVLGIYIKNERYQYFNITIFKVFLITFLIAFFELLLNKYSILSDYLFRRLFTVQPFLISAYRELYTNNAYDWNVLTGLNINQPISFYVGETIMGFPGLNANLNTFIYAIGQGGFFQYIIFVTIFVTVFIFIDTIYKSSNSGICLFLGFLLSILMVEQSITTILLSSGLGLLLLGLLFQERNLKL